MRYLEFAVASNFSFLRGASHPEELMVQATHPGLPDLGCAIAIPSPAWCARIWPSANKICHCAIIPARGSSLPTARPTSSPIRATAPAGEGSPACSLVGNLRAKKGDCTLYLDDLLAHAFGLELIAMSANAALLARLREAVPHRVRLAATMLYRGRDRRAACAAAMTMRATRSVPLIAVNDVLFHHPDRRPLADVLTCIREKTTIDRAGRKLAANAERYLKPPEEMMRLFRNAPEAIEETMALSDELSFSLDELRYEYPDEQVKGFDNAQDALGASHL